MCEKREVVSTSEDGKKEQVRVGRQDRVWEKVSIPVYPFGCFQLLGFEG